MTVYVDPVTTYPARRGTVTMRRRQWSHMIADTPEELRAMAERVGLDPSWIQHDGSGREHFDVTPPMRARALSAGAVEISKRELAQKIAAMTAKGRDEAESTLPS